MLNQATAEKLNTTKTTIYLCKKEKVLFTKTPKNIKPMLEAYKTKALSGFQVISLTENIFSYEIGESKGLDDLEQLKIAASKIAKQVITMKLKEVQIVADSAKENEVAAISLGLYYGEYNFDKYKSKVKTEIKSKVIIINSDIKSTRTILSKTSIASENINLCRNLINTTGEDLNPEAFMKIAKQMAVKHGLKIKVRNKAQLIKEGFNGLVTVGRGSKNPPYMVTLEYTPTKAVKDKKLAIVGKGMTFDTGGISLKPGNGMWEMKMDMGGAATTLGGICAIAKLKLPIKVVAVLCITENRPGENAVLPGDIFTARNGKTIMVENTDAEGRLVLTDGLYEAGACKATHIIDLATLTGAIIRAIGPSITGLFSNDDKFAQQTVKAGLNVGEKFWQMPMDMEYFSAIEDTCADLKNIGGDAGAITAALFLQEFVPKDTTWAHWDIAGTAFTTKPWKFVEHGATGWGVQSLVEVAKNLAKLPL